MNEKPKVRPGTFFRGLRLCTQWGLLPSLFYFLCFYGLTYPLLNHFSTNFFCDGGDGYQNVWNIWWVNKAVTELHCHSWKTSFLHYPHGVLGWCGRPR